MVTASLTAESTYTPALRIGAEQVAQLIVNSGSGTLSGTLTIQAIQSLSDHTTPGVNDTRWLDIEDVPVDDTPVLKTTNLSNCWVRVGFKAGAYTDGQADIKLKRVNIL